MNTKTTAGRPTQLNFDLKPSSASQASAATKKGKHMVWMPPATGSHTGGRWVEVDENGSSDTGALKRQERQCRSTTPRTNAKCGGPQSAPGVETAHFRDLPRAHHLT